jgi:hypothetical protein
MKDTNIRAALERHWAASDANDFNAEHQIYRQDAVLEYPQSGERIRGREGYANGDRVYGRTANSDGRLHCKWGVGGGRTRCCDSERRVSCAVCGYADGTAAETRDIDAGGEAKRAIRRWQLQGGAPRC